MDGRRLRPDGQAEPTVGYSRKLWYGRSEMDLFEMDVSWGWGNG